MQTTLRQLVTRGRITRALFLVGALILAIEPVEWLVRTWLEPSYDSPGGWIFLAAAALFVWSVTSRRLEGPRNTAHAWWLLLATAVIRLIGQLLAIDVLGALALTLDVYAVGVLCGIAHRKRAVSPAWLAVVFAFSLPVERIFQRLIGYALQHVSAAGSCTVLKGAFGDVVCRGTEITLAGKQVLVDLPCSGARGLVVVLVLFSTLAALVRPRPRQALLGGILAVTSALVANTFRITALAVGLAFPEAFGGIDVMAQPWHDLIGLAALALGLLPLVLWARRLPPSVRPRHAANSEDAATPAGKRRPGTERRAQLLLGLLFVSAAVAIPFIPHKPIDVAEPTDELELPVMLGGLVAQEESLSAREEDYFERFGGAASKARYGPHTLLVVESSAPLRHLHAPDECLAGAGYEVESRGLEGEHLPGASYIARRDDGTEWRVRVTYVSDDGEVATSISEVVWRWLGDTDSRWRAYQRVYPTSASREDIEQFDRSVARMFGIPESTMPRR